MNRIILAYAPENAALANAIDQQLSRIGIPFEHAKDSIATQIQADGAAVLLLVTDNFLTSRNCMQGLLPVLQALIAEKSLVAVLADGIDSNGQPIPTHIDRMANALHYMKYWQDEWLARSDRHQHTEGPEKMAMVAELDGTREIANAVGDLIGALRDVGCLTWEQFEANDFAAFFQQFGLQDWHGQYKRLAAQAAEKQLLETAQHLPEMPVSGGLLAPEPVSEPAHQTEASEPNFEAMDSLIETISMEAREAEPETSEVKAEERLAAQDAWFWMGKGHVQRGMELFQHALEHFPNSEWLKAEYEKAERQAAPVAPEIPAPPPAVPASDPSTDEAKSYDLMGDMAAERGDYLFAKYCWDRVTEVEPRFPNIYRKLGLMTAEHLRDYRETAAIYLHKALETNEHDAEIKTALKELGQVVETVPPAIVEAPEIVEEAPVSKEQNPASAIVSDPGAPKPKGQLVLITGATSGIGRATAEIFARNGYRLILTGRRVERLVELKHKLEAEFNTEALLLPFDVRDPGAVEAALSQLPEAFQEIDILVNNAGLAKGLAPIHEGNLEHWETMIDTNVKGLFYVPQMVAPAMVRRKRGHIINVGSSAGKETYPNGNVYCATKFAVDALSKSMRFDLHAHNIRVSQVSPGHVEETEFALTRFDGDADRAEIYNDFQPLKSSDVAEAIYFMATRPAHVNIQDLQLFATQQASSMVINRSGR